MSEKLKKINAPDLRRMKKRGEKIAMLTAYDATMAKLLDRAGIDVILVGDSVGMVVLGYDTTVPVTLDDILHHTKAVTRGVSRPLVVADMPFLTYKITVPEAVRNAGRLIQEGGASAVKVEGGEPVIDAVRRLVDVGIPVMAKPKGEISATAQVRSGSGRAVMPAAASWSAWRTKVCKALRAGSAWR